MLNSGSRILTSALAVTFLVQPAFSVPPAALDENGQRIQQEMAAIGRGSAPVTAQPLIPKGRCVNVNRTMEVPRDVRYATLNAIHENKINIVRIPLDFSNNTSRNSPFVVSPDYLDQVSAMVNHLTEKGMFVIIDFVRYQELNQHPDAETERFLEIWRQVSHHFRNSPRSVAFELFNEPRGRLDPSKYRILVEKAIAIVRKENEDRVIVVDTPWVAHYKGLEVVGFLNNKSNVVPSFHYYDPMAFTHQQANWMKLYQEKRDFGSEEDIDQFRTAMKFVRNYVAKTGKVPLVGEFGVIMKVPKERRVQYMKMVASGFSSLGLQTCAWTWDAGRQGFPIQAGKDLDPDFREAILKPN